MEKAKSCNNKTSFTIKLKYDVSLFYDLFMYM